MERLFEQLKQLTQEIRLGRIEGHLPSMELELGRMIEDARKRASYDDAQLVNLVFNGIR